MKNHEKSIFDNPKLRAIRMGNIVELELQKIRNKMMNGIPTETGVSVAFTNGRIERCSLLWKDSPTRKTAS